MSAENPKSNLHTMGEIRRVLKLVDINPKKFQDLAISRLTQPISQMITKSKKIKNYKHQKNKKELVIGIGNEDTIISGSILSDGPVEKIAKTLDIFGPLNTSQIKVKAGLSCTSVNRTLKLFREKKLVKVKIKARQNNEKIYYLNKDRTVFFIYLMQRKKFPFFNKEMQKNNMIWEREEKRFPQGFEDWEINVPEEAQKEFKIKSARVKINDLPFRLAQDLMNNFVAGFYCSDCFVLGNMSPLKWIDEDNLMCPLCGNEVPNFNELPIKDKSLKKRIWDVDQEIYKIMKRKS